MTKILESMYEVLWGAPALVLIIGVGICLTVRTDFVQVRMFPRAVRHFVKMLARRDPSGTETSPFRALCTALAATVGTGNLVGVAGAICMGGPGAVFWMWICGILAMATKYAEVVLAVRYRIRDASGYLGGPMYIIREAMGSRWKWMAALYCCFGITASFGVGNSAQINAAVSGINRVLLQFGVQESLKRNFAMGLLLAVLIGTFFFGGAGRIGKAAETMIPVVSAAYIGLCIWALILRREWILPAMRAIFRGAFSPRAVTGGALGSAFLALKTGCSRGVFTNEAGMGTASIAHASADTRHPAEQGLLGIMEVFLDTIVICTLTALVVLTSGISIPYGTDKGTTLASGAFSQVLGVWTEFFLAAALCCFAVATVLGWGLYGARCSQFLFGPKVWSVFSAGQILTVILGAVVKSETAWLLAEITNGMMAVPNLIVLAVLTPEVVRLTKEYKNSGYESTGGGNYADFYQCEPLRAFSHEKVSPSCGSGKK